MQKVRQLRFHCDFEYFRAMDVVKQLEEIRLIFIYFNRRASEMLERSARLGSGRSCAGSGVRHGISWRTGRTRRTEEGAREGQVGCGGRGWAGLGRADREGSRVERQGRRGAGERMRAAAAGQERKYPMNVHSSARQHHRNGISRVQS